MTEEMKIAFLRQYGYYKDRVNILNERKKAYKSSLYGLKAPILSDMPRGGVSKDIGDKIADNIELDEQIDTEIQALSGKMRYIHSTLSRLSNLKFISILELKYIDGMTNNQISAILDGMSINNVNWWRKKAIKALELTEKDLEIIK